MSHNVFFIAEAGVNHNGDVGIAKRLVDVAVLAGADAVKFQAFKASKLTTGQAETCDYQKRSSGKPQSQAEMLQNLELSEDSFIELDQYCKLKNIEFICTAFDNDSLDFLVGRTSQRKIKIPSGEMINPFLLLHAIRKGLPLILSTGLADIDEIERSLAVLAYGREHASGLPTNGDISAYTKLGKLAEILGDTVTILHCTSDYPAPYNAINLNALETLHRRFGLPIGLSDHSSGIEVPIAATALGATVIEKHFTLDKTLVGPDHSASLEPDELIALVHAIRNIEAAMGDGIKKPTPPELKNIHAIRGSLVASEAIVKNETFTTNNITVKRPGDGRSPMDALRILNTKSERDYQLDEQIK